MMASSISVKWWWAAAWGTTGVCLQLVRTRWPYVSDTSTTVYASGAGLPVELRVAVLAASAAAALGCATYFVVRRAPHPPARSLAAGLVWAVIASGLVLANTYLVDDFGVPSLLLTFAAAGAGGGLLSSVILRPASGVRGIAARMTVRWTLALASAALVGFYAAYLVGAGTIDAFEALSLGPGLGGIVGMFLTGGLAGSVAGAIGSIPRPGVRPLRA